MLVITIANTVARYGIISKNSVGKPVCDFKEVAKESDAPNNNYAKAEPTGDPLAIF